MTLSTMSIDEAIALACREVPGCRPPDVEVGVDFKDRTIHVGEPLFRSIWFHHAYCWLERWNAERFDVGPRISLWADEDIGWKAILCAVDRQDESWFEDEFRALAQCVIWARGDSDDVGSSGGCQSD